MKVDLGFYPSEKICVWEGRDQRLPVFASISGTSEHGGGRKASPIMMIVFTTHLMVAYEATVCLHIPP